MIRMLQLIALVSTLFGAVSALSVLPHQATQSNVRSLQRPGTFVARQHSLAPRGPIAQDASITTSASALHMSTVLDRPDVKTGGPAVLDRPQVEKRRKASPTKERKRVGSEAWEVRIYNDGMNTREFVARCLVQITYCVLRLV